MVWVEIKGRWTFRREMYAVLFGRVLQEFPLLRTLIDNILHGVAHSSSKRLRCFRFRRQLIYTHCTGVLHMMLCHWHILSQKKKCTVKHFRVRKTQKSMAQDSTRTLLPEEASLASCSRLMRASSPIVPRLLWLLHSWVGGEFDQGRGSFLLHSSSLRV